MYNKQLLLQYYASFNHFLFFLKIKFKKKIRVHCTIHKSLYTTEVRSFSMITSGYTDNIGISRTVYMITALTGVGVKFIHTVLSYRLLYHDI